MLFSSWLSYILAAWTFVVPKQFFSFTVNVCNTVKYVLDKQAPSALERNNDNELPIHVSCEGVDENK